MFIAQQNLQRINRSTSYILYSSTIINISQGVLFLILAFKRSYLSAVIINQDHYVNKISQAG
jgi:hypothetical protein